MEFRILGPLEVADDGRLLRLGSGRQLALVGLLLLHRNEVVSTERLVDELWGESPPPTAGKIVRNYVSLLRKELGDRLVTRPPGYLLRVEPGELDADRLERAVEDGNLEQLIGALALWRGAPLGQLTYQSFAQREIARLEELRLVAIEARIDAELERGHHAKLIPELEALVRAHPLREGLRAQLMLALYRSGRQSEALQAYQDARRTLTAELALEPGPELQRLQKAILAHDESLRAPPGSAVRTRRRGGLLIAAGATLLLGAGIAATTIELTSGGGAKSLSALAPNSVGVIDPKTNRVVAQVPVGGAVRIAAGEGAIWVGNRDARTVSRIDPRTRTLRQTVAVSGEPIRLAAGEGGVWILHSLGSSDAVTRIDPRHTGLLRTTRVPTSFGSDDLLALGAGAVWVAHAGPQPSAPAALYRVDAYTGRLVAQLGLNAYGGLAVGAGALWAAQKTSTLTRVDPRTASVTSTITLGTRAIPIAVAVGEGAVWVASRIAVKCAHGEFTPGFPCELPDAGIVTRIDPGSNAVVATIRVGGSLFDIAAGEGAVWIANGSRRSLDRIDPQTNQAVARIRLGRRPGAVTVGQGKVWVAVA